MKQKMNLMKLNKNEQNEVRAGSEAPTCAKYSVPCWCACVGGGCLGVAEYRRNYPYGEGCDGAMA